MEKGRFAANTFSIYAPYNLSAVISRNFGNILVVDVER